MVLQNLGLMRRVMSFELMIPFFGFFVKLGVWKNFSFKFGKDSMIQNTDEIKSVISI